MEKKKNKKKGKTKDKYRKRTFLITFLIVMGIFGVIRHAFSIDIPLHTEDGNDSSLAMADTKSMILVDDDETADLFNDESADCMPSDEINKYAEEADSAATTTEEAETSEDNADNETAQTQGITRKYHRIRGVWSYDKCFPDVQDVQIVAAMKNGIKPAKNRDEAERYVLQRKLVNVGFSPYYSVDNLTHSIPYLVPKAQHLLNTIAINFIDSCQVKGVPPHKIMITSILRTTDDVKSLQKGNGNATTNSCHCYGTTVDIAYNKFVPITGTYNPRTPLLRWDEPMKQILSEVLDDLRRENKIYVKYEVKQGCYHLTCR